MRRLLLFQLVILALCGWAVAELATNFPYPSPLIRPLLPPKLRWPTQQIQGWVDAESFPAGFLAYFARDPERTIPQGANLVAPADGVIGYEFHNGGLSYLVVRMSFWDVHVIRAPAAGVVTDLEEEGIRVTRSGDTEEQKMRDIYERGKDAPVQKIVTFQTSFGELKVRMISSYWASRLKVWVHRGQQVRKGERIGRILLGSTTVLEMPGNVVFSVKPGQHVAGGETIVYRAGE
jgi:phosphatidylserine decarboxylase